MKRILAIVILVAIICVSVIALSGCSYSKSEKEYWFSEYSTKFIKYDDSANNGAGNLEEAGSYWEMTVKSDCQIKISISANSIYTMFSTMYFYVNDVQVKSETDTGVFTFVYDNLNLKKGDKLKFHAFWTNSLVTEDKAFTIDIFAIDNGEQNYIIDNM